jgi:hypothetical protein
MKKFIRTSLTASLLLLSILSMEIEPAFSTRSAYADDTSTTTPTASVEITATSTPAESDTSITSATTTEDVPSQNLTTTSTSSPSSLSTTSPTASLEITSAEEIGTTTEITATTTPTNGNSGNTGNASSDPNINNPTIVSGKAVALANILNILNTNSINSDGAVLLSNFIDDHTGDIDFRNGTGSQGTCSLSSCTGTEGIQVRLIDDAFLQNAIVVQAASGNNEINGGDTSIISTGDAYAGLNLVNLANTNFVDSQYLLITLNAFKDLKGDIVFPGINTLFGSNKATSSPSGINTLQNADINNKVKTDAEAGGNEIEAEKGTIRTGDAASSSNVFNQINTSLAGGDTLSVLLRVHGNWAGELFGAPKGLDWQKGENGLFFLTNQNSNSGSSGNTVSGTSTASIDNDLTVGALSGDNKITGAKTALITTGNAFAGVNLINIANANVIGRNWLLAIINIFGNFTGNIAFGRPDLWVGQQIDAPEFLDNGKEITFKLTVINNGDAEATDITLTDEYDTSHFDIVGSSMRYGNEENGKLVWKMNSIPPGGATELTLLAKVKDTEPGTSLSNHISIQARETDNNLLDNTDTAEIQTSIPEKKNVNHRNGPLLAPLTSIAIPGFGMSSGGGQSSSGNQQSSLGFVNPFLPQAIAPNSLSTSSPSTLPIQVIRTTASTTLSLTNRTAPQEIIIRNTLSIPLSSIILHDLLADPAGKVIQDEKWDIGDLLGNEEINIQYTINFDDQADLGLYHLSTILTEAGSSTTTLTNGTIRLLGKENASVITPKLPALPKIISVTQKKPISIFSPKKQIVNASSTPFVTNKPKVALADVNTNLASVAEIPLSSSSDSVYNKLIARIKKIQEYLAAKLEPIFE